MFNERGNCESFPNPVPKKELAKFMLSLVMGRYEDEMLTLAARASIAGGVSVTAAIAGFFTNRLEITAAGGALTFLSGFIALNAISASRRLD